jgi:hypothetical protein
MLRTARGVEEAYLEGLIRQQGENRPVNIGGIRFAARNEDITE